MNICYTKSVTGNTVTLKGKRIKGQILMPCMNADEGYQPSEFIPPFFFLYFQLSKFIIQKCKTKINSSQA
nr:hypothetical protein DZ987_13800 [Enterococcus faecium]